MAILGLYGWIRLLCSLTPKSMADRGDLSLTCQKLPSTELCQFGYIWSDLGRSSNLWTPFSCYPIEFLAHIFGNDSLLRE